MVKLIQNAKLYYQEENLRSYAENERSISGVNESVRLKKRRFDDFK